MTKTSVVGFPRIGAQRELKFWTESYFKGRIGAEELLENAKSLRKDQWLLQKKSGLDFIPSNDFSFYDGVLDTAALVGAVPAEYRALGLSALDTYFAMARGYQGENGDVKALSMKKWFNTNYHYIVPVLEDDAEIKISGGKPFELFAEALELGIKTKPIIVGPFTFLKLAVYRGAKTKEDFAQEFIAAYSDILAKLGEMGAEWVQLDEPYLVTDLDKADIEFFTGLYKKLLAKKDGVKILLQTYFGDVRDIYSELAALDFDGIGLDFTEGKKSLEFLRANGLPGEKLLFAGVLNGKNIWRNDYSKTLALLDEIKKYVPEENIVISSSCSLLHVPYSLDSETKLDEKYKRHFAFAREKLGELEDLKKLFESGVRSEEKKLRDNINLLDAKKQFADREISGKIAALTEKDFIRLPAFAEREKIQKEALALPPLPTTTIGSFPQTGEVQTLRTKLRKKEITPEEYKNGVKAKIAEWIEIQENLGIDVLVHGEFERNDMVEYFGENFSGCLFTQKAWVQSYGTRCVKPPIIWGDIRRERPITVEYGAYAQSLTDRPVKGMLTGPVTILNWSFPREDVSSKEMAFQIALAIRDEVLDLEANGIRVIQIDEAALKEKLPIRRADWHSEYLDWAIPAFRLAHSGVGPRTQIHTHMCYSEFAEIVKDIDAMDADVISFEASRSNLEIVDVLRREGFRTEVGPGIYDIHSPRIPSEGEFEGAIRRILEKLSADKVWINPDCGLKTRAVAEVLESLKNMVAAAKAVRKTL
ncbi:MAG: 5-methyltetrahydropteroyltriglutamate--homocysteine S-methyltransferase [Oscillospiraceae bacterium]|jgi:5-methyltetrahydropteroyltriglutamate--homocysteine methyltransferase|nr:5-methyltetrahydropteroyltriglutamate--homocysteine S-methyltransferase [Oscillospiraceae bacterium]